MKITELTAVTLGKKIKAKEITVAEAVSAVLEQIEAVEGDVHAYVTQKDNNIENKQEEEKIEEDKSKKNNSETEEATDLNVDVKTEKTEEKIKSED